MHAEFTASEVRLGAAAGSVKRGLISYRNGYGNPERLTD